MSCTQGPVEEKIPAYRIVQSEQLNSGVIAITPEIEIPETSSGYTLWLPETDPAGLIVFQHWKGDTTEVPQMVRYALASQLAVVYISTSNRLEFFFEETHMAEVLIQLNEIIEAYSIPRNRLMYCGMSLEGTRALRLTEFGQENDLDIFLRPRAIALCDAPLDMIRFHREGRRAAELDFHPAASNEGYWVSEYLEANLGGTPDSSLERYIDYSPYTYGHSDETSMSEFSHISIRAYTEPDVHWWMAERGKDYYGMNSLDMAAFINAVRLMGNTEAELITTTDKGYFPDGRRHPHSWSIVDEKELVEWFAALP